MSQSFCHLSWRNWLELPPNLMSIPCIHRWGRQGPAEKYLSSTMKNQSHFIIFISSNIPKLQPWNALLAHNFRGPPLLRQTCASAIRRRHTAEHSAQLRRYSAVSDCLVASVWEQVMGWCLGIGRWWDLLGICGSCRLIVICDTCFCQQTLFFWVWGNVFPYFGHDQQH